MPNADSWHIKSRAHQCSISEKPFNDGEPFFTAIFPDPESDGYLRLDFSQEAWDDRDEEAPSPFSFWRTVYRPPEVMEKIDIVDKDDPETLLTSLIEQDEAHTENTRYILAIMLERKKILVETDSQKTGTGLLRIYEHRHSGEVFIVKDPLIPLPEIAPIQEEVQRLLSPDEAEAASDQGQAVAPSGKLS
ncbi:MAG TPA: hypothetical protein DIV54_08785 [Verrucomicrobiales bacterium]|nr:hypothetical protein [Roseibacillus sp.]HCQ33584.1 hypothetical protein [Verrucomicrobiales bacterium]